MQAVTSVHPDGFTEEGKQVSEPIAIIGIGCRFPGGVNDPQSYWDLLMNGVDAVSEIPVDRLDLLAFYSTDHATPGTFISRWGGFLSHIDQFSPEFFGISPREAASMDPQQRLLLEVAWESLEDAGEKPESLAGSSTGVFIGISTHDFSDIKFDTHNRRLIDAHTATGGALSIAANRISYVLDLRGPSMAIDTACSSSLVAVHQACQSIRHHECSLAIAGGVNLLLCAEPFIGFSKAAMLSPDGRCKAFDEKANGYVRSEGAGAVLLKPLSRALSDGDLVYSVILGSGVNQDGHSKGMTMPNVSAQEALLRQACDAAGIKPAAIQYAEAHGTGTPVGDPIEANAIGRVLSQGRPADNPCLIGSVKTNLGHLEAASGIAGLIKVALSLEKRTIPASLHFQHGNPEIDFEELKLQVPTSTTAWPLAPGERAVASVNSFGFGGTNAHVVAAAAPPSAQAENDNVAERPHILPISARSEEELNILAESYVELLADERFESRAVLRDLCYSAGARRSHYEHRLALLAHTPDEFCELFNEFIAGEPCPDLWSGRKVANREPKLAFVFSGMGPQWSAMGRELFHDEPVFRSVIEECDELFRCCAGWSLREEMMADEEQSRMEDTDVAQPASFALQTALTALLRSWGIEPAAVTGHSAGEVAAVHAAGAMNLEEAIQVIFHRSRLQHITAGQGNMVAVHLPLEDAESLAAELGEEVSVAAINGPSDITLSVSAGQLDSLLDACRQRGNFQRLLRGNVPYHSVLMNSIKGELLEALKEFRPRSTDLPLISTVTGKVIPGEKTDAGYWWRNIRHPVLFAEAIGTLLETGCDTFLEIGPHPVLSSFISTCLRHRKREGTIISSLRRKEKEVPNLMGVVGALYTRGYPVDWQRIYPTAKRHVRLPGYPWQRETHWRESEESRRERTDCTAHPLLGRQLSLALPVWENYLDLSRFPYLADHQVQGTALMPAAAYVEMALAAGSIVLGSSPFILEDVEFTKTLFLADGAHPKIQLVCRPDEAHFDIFSSTGAGERSWVLHASGRFLPFTDDRPKSLSDCDAVRSRCPDELSASDCYENFRQMGLEYGPCFQGIDRLWRAKGEAFASLRTSAPPEAGQGSYHVHPTLLDACFQVLVGAVDSERTAETSSPGVYLPVRIRQLRLHARSDSPSHCTARIHKQTSSFMSGDIRLWSASGDLLLEILGFRCQSLAALKSQTVEDPVRDCLYQFNWMPGDHRQRERASDEFALPNEIVERVRTETRALTPEEEDAVVQVQQQLDVLAGGYILAAYGKLGFPPGGQLSENELAATLGVIPEQRRLFGRYLWLLEQEGVLQRTGDQWEVRPAPEVGNLNALAEDLRSSHPDAHELDLLERCGGNLAEVLLGRADPLELLFPASSIEETEKVYRSSPSFRLYNLLIQSAITVGLDRLPSDREINVLEIGAGTGGATPYVLQALPAERTRYVFSDTTAMFLPLAEEKFRDRPGFEARILDIERKPGEQGFERHSFDIVVAADVLHATRDLRETLGNVQELLAPNGLLIILEVTSSPRWVDLVFGITEGWFRFVDTELRPSYPLLSREQWVTLLKDEGFREAGALIHEFKNLASTQTVLLARAPAAAPKESREGPLQVNKIAGSNWLILADSGNLGTGIGELIEENGGAATLIHLNDQGRHGRDGKHFTTDPEQPEQMAALLENVSSSVGDCHGVVHMWSLDASPPDRTSVSSLAHAQALSCNSLISLLKVLLARPRAVAPALWLVTRGAQPAAEHAVSMAQAPIIGIGRVLRNEVPNLKTRMVDLDPATAAEEIAALWDELGRDDGEEEVALRGDRRMVSRFSKLALEETLREKTRRPGEDTVPFRLEIPTPGVLDNLRLKEVARKAPGGDEVEVRVHAAGLNFRDVMLAMGLLLDTVQEGSYFGQALGMECGGKVTAVGENVRGISVGDPVIAQGRASFAAYMTTHADYVVPKPPRLTFEEGATIPVVFITAYYALHRLSKLAPGERILIHAAAGGVGLAAVMLAQEIGAEIFATAGSEEKREFLRSLGIKHVMSSRKLIFADEIMETSGGEGVDVVLNSLAGEAIAKSISVLGPLGRFVEIGKTDIAEGNNLNLAPFANSLSYFAVDIDRILDARPKYAASLFQEAMRYFDEHGFHPIRSMVYPLADVAQAFRDMAQARHIGKIVVSMDDESAWIERDFQDASVIRPDATYLITGGLGGFGLVVAEWMVKAGARQVVLVSRSGLVEHSATGTAVEAMRASGADIVVAKADVAEEEQVADLMASIKNTMPPLRGVIHAAMVLDDGYIEQLDHEKMSKVLAPKVLGAWNLHSQTLDCELDFFVLFSSVSTIFGNPGQGNYVAANVALDAFAHHRRWLGLPAVSIRWGALGQVGYLARHEEISQFLDQQGLKQFSPDEALRCLANVIRADVTQAVAARMDWGRWSQAYPRSANSPRFSEALRGIADQQTQESSESVLDSLLRLAAQERQAFLEDYLAEKIGKVLRTSGSKLNPDNPVTDHGLDSLMALELKNRVDTDLETDLSITSLLQGPSIRDLATLLLKQIGAAASEDQAGKAPKKGEEGYLVAIQPLGEKLPLFGIHPSNGLAGCYAELALQLGTEQPFYGIESSALKNGDGVGSSIEELALSYIRLVRTKQPEGPYSLVGYSMGGAIAFDMAQQLRGEGEVIGALVMIDTPAPSLGREAEKLDDAQLITWFVKELGMAFGKDLHASREELLALDEEERISYVSEEIRGLKIDGQRLSRELVGRMLSVFRGNVRAHIEYVPTSYCGEVVFFAAGQETPEYLEKHPDFERPGYGWDRWIDSLNVQRLDGSSHHNILTGAYVHSLIPHLRGTGSASEPMEV